MFNSAEGRVKVRRLLLAAVIAALVAVAAFVAFARADPLTHITLTTIHGQGSGTISLSPTAKDEVLNGVDLQFDVQVTVNIHGANPNTVFTVSRNPDFTVNGSCPSQNFLALNPTFTTSAGGAGAAHYEVQRGPPTLFVEGARFDVSFKVAGSDGTLLTSECITVTVK
jgi:hypothetical protein